MPKIIPIGPVRRVAALTGAALALAVPATAAAQYGTVPMTIELGPTATLEAHLLATVPVEVSCPVVEGLPFMSSSFFGRLEQAARPRRTIAFGSGTIGEVVCDGAVHAYAAQFVADPAGPPFRRGQAVVSLSGQVCFGVIYQSQVCAVGASGWQVVKLVRPQ